MSAILRHFLNVLSLLGILAFTASQGVAAPDSLEQAITERNPELQSLRAKLEASRALEGPAGAWMDPRLSLELMDVPSAAGPKLSLSQMIPLQGQPSLMARMAALEVEMLLAQLADRTLMLQAGARQALIDLAYVDQTSRILANNQDLADRMSRVSEAKYAVGKGMQSDILRAHVARTKLFEPLFALEFKRAAARASLAAIAPGYEAAAPMQPIQKLPPLADLLVRAEAKSPMLHMKRLDIQHAELGVELARAERVPDLEIGTSLGRQMPGDMPYVSGMVSMTLPVWSTIKQNQRVLAAEHRRAEAQKAMEAARLDLVSKMTTAHAMLQEAERLRELYHGGLLAQAQQTFKATLTAYQVNQGDFLMVLDSQMALNDIEMANAMAQAEQFKMTAMLQAMEGGSPDDWRRP